VPTGEVIRLDLRTGEQTARTRLPGTPWGITTVGDRLYVSLTSRSEIVELAPNTLEPQARIPTPESPTDLTAVDRRLVVHIAPQSALILLDPASGRHTVLLTSNLVFAGESESSSAVPLLESRESDTSLLQVGRLSAARCTMPLLDRPGTVLATVDGAVYAALGDYRDVIRIAPCN